MVGGWKRWEVGGRRIDTSTDLGLQRHLLSQIFSFAKLASVSHSHMVLSMGEFTTTHRLVCAVSVYMLEKYRSGKSFEDQ